MSSVTLTHPARPVAAGLTRELPGWHVWYHHSRQMWIARRLGDFEQEDDGLRVYSVSASAELGLLREVNDQAMLDIAAEFPDWEIWPDLTWGVWHGEGPCGADGDGTCMLGALTVPALLHGIRLAVGA